MKKVIFLLLILISIKNHAQDFKSEWTAVIQYELDGKVKSANEIVEKIYKKAKRKELDDQVIKCFFYQSKFIQVTDENYQSIVIDNIRNEIKNAKGSKKAILKHIYASILESYYDQNRYEINRRTAVKNNSSKDFKTWSEEDFQNQLSKTYEKLLENEDELRQTSIIVYKSIFEISPYTDGKNISIYDYLQEKVLAHYFKNLGNFIYNTNNASLQEFIKKSEEFIAFKTESVNDENLKKIIEIYQKNEKYHLAKNPNKVQLLQYNRMKKFYHYLKNNAVFFEELSKLEQQATNEYLLQDIKVDFATHYYDLTFKESEKNYYPQVLTMVDTILSKRENPNAKATAENLKEKILKKELSLNIPSELYANQNYRAFIAFKNVDTLKVHYYKLPFTIFKTIQDDNRNYKNDNFRYIDKDSLVLDFVTKNEPILSTIKILPYKTDHFSYTTEILMDNLDLGRYLVYFETENPYFSIEKAYAYKTVQVSNIDYVQERVDDFDTFSLLHQKTGKPLATVAVQNNNSNQKSDKNGKIKFEIRPVKSGQPLYSELLFTKELDTLYTNYTKSVKYDEQENEVFDAKAMVFFDRAIYRPGQKVYFKGYMFQNKNNKKSVVPNLSIHLIIEDVNGNEVKTLNLQTNEFGSFNGEYDIAKNVLTGEFSLRIEEPDDYEIDTKYYNEEEDEHSFWDNVEYNDYQNFSFKVEEYKRPTFEITFDEIKENYTIGDSITIKGNAKTLAGSNLTNAKVAYTISKNISLKNDYYSNTNDKINLETTTDENGTFEIRFVATQEGVENSRINLINYYIDTSITDVNGETRTANTAVVVGDKMLKINALVKPQMVLEEKLSLLINATTLNNYPIDAKGTITFYENLENNFLIKREQFPELNTIAKKEFQKLFPFEAYAQSDLNIDEKMVKTISFDTKKSTTVDLSFMKDFQLGNYKIVIETQDQKGNEISAQNYFELISLQRKANKKALFTINQLDTDKDNFVFEILSVVPDLYVTTSLFESMSKNLENVTLLKNGYGVVKFPKKSNYDYDLQFHFSTLWEKTYFSNQIILRKEEIKTNLDFEIVSMRNKIEPGSNESWSFLVKNSKLQSEVLASMYDTSLDQFASSSWDVQEFYNNNYFPSVTYKNTYWYNNNVAFKNLYFSSNYYKNYTPNPEIYWFGFYFNNKNSYITKQYLTKVNYLATVPKNAKTVYGVVSDKIGPLPGANVIVKGTNRGTQTDFDGNFQIDVEKGEILEFSFTGFQNKSVLVEKEKEINISLSEQANMLNEVVVVGYGVEKKSSVTGAVSRITASNLVANNDIAATGSLEDVLQGNVPGLSIVAGSGQPGQVGEIRIRGANSLNGTSDPLFIVDGVVMTEAEF